MTHEYQSQHWTAQDKFVAENFNFMRDGYFLDIGCHHYKEISNTYFLEKELNWRGIGVEIEQQFQQGWIENRPNSLFVCADAVQLDYQKLLDENNAPKVIDYLSVDIEPPYNTLLALQKVMESDYLFKIITFEIDLYRDPRPRDISRELLPQKGYKYIKEINMQDDYWVHPDYITEIK
jgi:hypothetical protein